MSKTYFTKQGESAQTTSVNKFKSNIMAQFNIYLNK